ncbi:hypothetical protein B296_00038003 [Ensete ventricosum]|uniref:Uncharacterized protein n=1 Tax=Ensete ventricosum TaxID=4639 RepID=A0A426YCN0_ENSVE|nr:hypothetical protein B296_00038003 [Ensete ventricosum]
MAASGVEDALWLDIVVLKVDDVCPILGVEDALWLYEVALMMLRHPRWPRRESRTPYGPACPHVRTVQNRCKIIQALKRLKGTSTDKKGKMLDATKQIFDQLTEGAMKLMENGDYS